MSTAERAASMSPGRKLIRAIEDIATAPDRTFKAPRWLPAPWSVTIPVAVALVLALAALVVS